MIFEVEVQRGQHSAHDVRRRERIAAVFREDDAVAPEALALRSDFPLVPHVKALNLTFLEEFPRSLTAPAAFSGKRSRRRCVT